MLNNITLSQEFKIPIPINHDKQQLQSTILTKQEFLIQIYYNMGNDKITSTILVLNIKNNYYKLYEIADQIFQVKHFNENHLVFLSYEKDSLMFLNFKDGKICSIYKGSNYMLLFHPQVNIQISEYRDLYFNQAISYAINQDDIIAILCDFRVTNKKEVLISLQKNNQLISVYSYFQQNNNFGKMILCDIQDYFIVVNSIIEDSNLQFLILNSECQKEYKIKLPITEETNVVKLFYLKQHILLLLNDNNFGNPWVIVMDSQNFTIKNCNELQFQMNDNKFAVILDAFLIKNYQLLIFYEMNIDGMNNEQFLQAIDISNDLKMFTIADFKRFPEASVSKIIATDCGFITIPRAVEIGIITNNFLEYDINPISMGKNDNTEQKIQKLNEESKLVYYNRLPDVFCISFHFMKNCNIFAQNQNDGFQNLAEEIIQKLKNQIVYQNN